MMNWVENLKPDEEVEVEIIYPDFYIDHNLSTMRRYAAGISNICKGYALLGEENCEILVWGMATVQVITLETMLKDFGIEMEHDMGKLQDGTSWTYFYCDLRGLKEMYEGEDINDGI